MPKPVIQQLFEVLPLKSWAQVHVCCSGSFRVDRAIKDRCGNAVYSNDVSLLSCALGALLIQEPFEIRFKERLAWVDGTLQDSTFVDRVAAVLVALDLSRNRGKSRYAQTMFEHMQSNFHEYHARALAKLAKFTKITRIDGFYAGDFRDHARAAIEKGAFIVSFPPTYKGGYEAIYRFLDKNIDWPRASYRVFDPATIGEWIGELDQADAQYCVLSDHRIEGRNPVARYYSSTNKPVFLFARSERGALRRKNNKTEPIAYIPCETDQLRPDSVVQIAAANAAQMNFLKDRFLAKGIAHAPGDQNWLVFIDGKLCGGFIYTPNNRGVRDQLYLLSDFAIVGQRRISKLIALLATSREVVHRYELAKLLRIRTIMTTAFTDHAVSMKYRGVFELQSRKPGMLNYVSQVRDMGLDETYRHWWKRYANADKQGQAAQSQAA